MDTCRCSCTRGFGLDEAACRSATLMFTDLFVAAAVAAAVGWFGLGMDPCERWCCSPSREPCGQVVVCVSGSAASAPTSALDQQVG